MIYRYTITRWHYDPAGTFSNAYKKWESTYEHAF